jgi:hypothetical protein
MCVVSCVDVPGVFRCNNYNLIQAVMIYSSLILGLFMGAGYGASTHSAAKSIVEKGKARMAPTLRQPLTLSGKLEQVKRVKAVQESHPDNIADVSIEEAGHLRALQMKNNFVGFSYFTDSACNDPHVVFGSLVNCCFNEVGTASGNKRSYYLKMNKKTHTLVELQFEGKNCKGIPEKVTDMFGAFLPDFTKEMDYGECFFDSSTGSYATANYWATYPDFSQYTTGYYGQTYTANKCTTENKDYFEFWYQQFVDIPRGCVAIEEDGNSLYYNSCGADGMFSPYINIIMLFV